LRWFHDGPVLCDCRQRSEASVLRMIHDGITFWNDRICHAGARYSRCDPWNSIKQTLSRYFGCFTPGTHKASKSWKQAQGKLKRAHRFESENVQTEDAYSNARHAPVPPFLASVTCHGSRRQSNLKILALVIVVAIKARIHEELWRGVKPTHDEFQWRDRWSQSRSFITRIPTLQHRAHDTQHSSFRAVPSDRWPAVLYRRSLFPAGCVTGHPKDVPNWIKISVQRSKGTYSARARTEPCPMFRKCSREEIAGT